MEWFRKFFGRDDYTSDQDKFAAVHSAAKAPRGMVMLVGSDKLFQDMVYIRGPATMAVLF
jgi:hypothetical protein